MTDISKGIAKTIIIGLDGVPFGMIKNFAETGIMPNTASVISKGLFTKMRSSIPEVSSVAWSSMITGLNPGGHDIYGFMDLLPNTYNMTFPNFNSLKAQPFWDQWQGKSVIINVPSTYPVRKMKGVLISGFVSIDFEKSVYPKKLANYLKKLDYRLDVDSRKAHTSMDEFLDDLDKTLNARIEAYRYLWDAFNWQTFMLVFTGTDRLMHFLWDAYEDAGHKYHDFFINHFRKIDSAIGEILDKISDDNLLVMHSDHGFERVDNEVYINYLLENEGFLQYKQDADRAIKNIGYETKAFTLDPARIYLNYKGKYPCGSVEPSESEGIIAELENILGSLEYNGKKVIKDIYRKEQIYSGPYIDNAPDLTLVGNEGFDLKAKVKSTDLYGKAIFTGKHTQDTAFLLIKGLADESIVPETPAVHDIKGIIEKLLIMHIMHNAG